MVEEVQEVGPVGAGFVAAVVLAVSELAFHKAEILAREYVGGKAFSSKQLIYGCRLGCGDEHSYNVLPFVVLVLSGRDTAGTGSA